MVYAVDFVLNIMNEISSSEPVLFQRDGSLYIASAEGFGQVNCGLRTMPEKIQQWEQREQAPEIKESTDAVLRRLEGKLVFKKSEKPYINAIAFGPDDQVFSLESIAKTARELKNLPDDGKIRMVNHESRYHSHKYGYACDGTDVWVMTVRVMDQERYLDLVRQKEDKLIRAMGDIKVEDRHDFERIYTDFQFPDCVILTPFMQVSLPRSGRIERDVSSWTEKTHLHSDYDSNRHGSLLTYGRVDTSRKSPFAVGLTFNSFNFKAKSGSTLNLQAHKVIDRVREEFDSVALNMGIAESIVNRMNRKHNKVCEENIKWFEETLRK